MCIAIYQPAGKRVTEEQLHNCFSSNKDGCGFAYINTDNHGVKKIKVKKSLDFNVFLRQYNRAMDLAGDDSPFLIHFRIKTHGKIDTANCHPFMIDKNHVFIHNGIISGVGYDSDKSDTRLFCEKYLKGLPKGWLKNDSIMGLIGSFISSSKLVIMNSKGEARIVNESKGSWDGGIWFSNTSYKPKVVTPTVVKTPAVWVPGERNYRYGDFQREVDGWGRGNQSHKGSPGFHNKSIQRPVYKESGYSITDYVPCQSCGMSAKVCDTISYISDGTCNIYCRTCDLRVRTQSYALDKEDLLTGIALLDYLNTDPEEEYNTSPLESIDTWKNPWGDLDTTFAEVVEMEEVMEAVYEDSMEVH